MSSFVNRKKATAETLCAFNFFGIVEMKERELLKPNLVDFFMNHGRYDLELVYQEIQNIKSRSVVL
ncbi:MAG: hypothetical protein WC069_03545 [Candidatus Shapirobacteria bacterium]